MGGFLAKDNVDRACRQYLLLLQLIVRIEFDPDKDKINRVKHGVSLALAADMDLEAALIEPDQRYSYGEARFQAIGPISDKEIEHDPVEHAAPTTIIAELRELETEIADGLYKLQEMLR